MVCCFGLFGKSKKASAGIASGLLVVKPQPAIDDKFDEMSWRVPSSGKSMSTPPSSGENFNADCATSSHKRHEG